MTDIQNTLSERGKRYGSFIGHATVSQNIQFDIKQGIEYNPNVEWDHLDDDMKEALFMIAHKIGRIVNGDPWYADSWVDIAGYAQLIVDRLEENNNATTI